MNTDQEVKQEQVEEVTKASTEDNKSEIDDIRESRGRPPKKAEHVAELKLLEKAFRLEKNKLKKQIIELENKYKKDREAISLKYKVIAKKEHHESKEHESKEEKVDIEQLMKENEELKAKLTKKSTKKAVKPRAKKAEVTM
jgi:hypothetical protein